MSKSAPPGWSPSEITSRLDGWTVVDPDRADMPPNVAHAIFGAMPKIGSGHSAADIRARMLRRMQALGIDP